MATATTAGPLDRLKKNYAKAGRTLKNWRLRRRRRRATKRRGKSRKLTIALFLLLALLFAAFFGSLRFLQPRSEGVELSLDELAALASEKRIATATFRDEDKRLVGTFVAEPLVDEEPERNDRKRNQRGDRDQNDNRAQNERGGDRSRARDDGGSKNRGGNAGGGGPEEETQESVAPPGAGRYWVTYPSSDAAFAQLSDLVSGAGARVSVDAQGTKRAVRAIATYLLPLLILATFFGLLFATGRGASSGIGEVMTFGQIGTKRQKKGLMAPVTFTDVAGADEAVAELKEVVDYLSDPERYEDIGAMPPKGVLLFGPPGCGKTLLAKAVAGEAGVPFFSVAGAEFVESLVGVGAARVRDLFARVRAVAPAIVFIDELDAAGRRRGHGGGSGGSDEREQTLNQLLVEMDGFEVSSGIVVVGATNRPDILDPALLRPGRFDRHITVDQPDAQGREQILRLHGRNRPIASSVDYSYLARRTPGFSGADLANVINEAALLSVRERKPEIEMKELEEAVERVLHGPQRRGRVLTPEERERAAYHESGHAIIAAATGRADDVHRVSLLARARGISVTGILRESDAYLLTRSQLFGQLVTSMAGMAAEELVFGEPSTGAEKDLEHATELARDMIGRYGFSPRIGRLRLIAPDAEVYLSGDSGLNELSVKLHEDMDAEVRVLLDGAEEEAVRLLESNREVLDHMAEVLQGEETLEGPPLLEILERVPQEMVDLHAVMGLAQGNGRGNGRVGEKPKRTKRPTRERES